MEYANSVHRVPITTPFFLKFCLLHAVCTMHEIPKTTTFSSIIAYCMQYIPCSMQTNCIKYPIPTIFSQILLVSGMVVVTVTLLLNHYHHYCQATGLGLGTWDLGPGTWDLGIESRIENRESRIENRNYPQSQEMTVKCPGPPPPPTTTPNF